MTISFKDIEVKAAQFLVSKGQYPIKLLLGTETLKEFSKSFTPKEVIRRIDLGGGKNCKKHPRITKIWLFGGCLEVVKTKHKRYFRVV